MGKAWKAKTGTKNKREQERVTSMADTNAAMSTLTADVGGLSKPIRRGH